MSIDDRIRTAIEATAATVREVGPLTFPDDQPGIARPARPRPARRWGSWLIPLAAAAAVIVVAASLVVARSLTGASPAPAVGINVKTGAWPPASVNRVPAYYVAIGPGTAKDLVVGDAFTGQVLATVAQPASATFSVVAGAGDGRTFVVDAETGGQDTRHQWYLLRLTPGTADPVRLTQLPIGPDLNAMTLGLALSPDGRTLAVLDLPNGLSPLLHPNPNSPQFAHRVKVGALTLRTYSAATGQALRTWTRPWSGLVPPANSDYAALQWLGDGHTLAFEYPLGTAENFTAKSSVSVLTLDTSRPGSDLKRDARVVFHTPVNSACPPADGLLSPDGGTFFCAGPGMRIGAVPGFLSGPTCESDVIAVAAYSTITGRQEKQLYQRSVPCNPAASGYVAWTGPGQSAIVVIDAPSVPSATQGFGLTTVLMSPGRLTPLQVGARSIFALGKMAF